MPRARAAGLIHVIDWRWEPEGGRRHGSLSRTLGLTKAHADLIRAVRGGGDNFGVTSFLFQLHPIRTVYGGPML